MANQPCKRCGELEELVHVLESQIQALQQKIQPSRTAKSEEITITPSTVSVPIQQTISQTRSPTPFDVADWIQKHGGIHLHKLLDFKMSSIQLIQHVCFDEKAGFYYTLNTYRYPDGTVSLGQNSKGGNKYPLKGKRLIPTLRASNGFKEKRAIIGRKTLKEAMAHFESKGYIHSTPTPGTLT